MRKQDIVQQNETDGEELQQRAQQCLAEQLVHDLVREDSRAGAVELRAALTLQSAWRGRRGRALAEAQAVEMLQQNQQELTTLLAELELQQRRSQLVELQRLESQLKQLEKQKQLTLSPTAAEEGEPPERTGQVATRPGSSSSSNRVRKSSPRAQVQLTSPVRTSLWEPADAVQSLTNASSWSPDFGRHPSALVFKEQDALHWSRPRRESNA